MQRMAKKMPGRFVVWWCVMVLFECGEGGGIVWEVDLTPPENSASHFILFIFQPGSNLKIIPSSVPQPTGQADKSHEKIDFFHFPNNSTTPSTHNEDCCWTYVDTDLCLT